MCWQTEESLRPAFEEVCEQLVTELQESVAEKYADESDSFDSCEGEEEHKEE